MQFTSLYDIRAALSSARELEQIGKAGNAPDFFRPYHFVLLGLTLTRMRSEDFRFSGFDGSFLRYASRMHFWNAIGMKAPVDVSERDATGRFHPLTRLDDADTVQDVSIGLSALFPDDGTRRSIGTAVSELVDNSYSHSDISSGLRGFVCAQKWSRGSKAQVAIGDSGIGIRRSLSASKEYQDQLSAGNSCELATRYDVTGKRVGHSGYGLTLARDLIVNNGGAFFLASDEEYYVNKLGNADAGTLSVPMQGTLVVLEWNTQVPLDVKAVYDSWPMENDDDFNF